ncbi:MAG: hypothetical protein QOF98_154 [Streptomyces sp.]|nr:hypothetical protein [Streptomyces sp.]
MSTPIRGISTRAVQAEQTRQQILETAQRLFADLGYDATSLQMIADEMGLTKAAVYYHFRAKNDLLHECMKPGILRIEALLNEAATMRSRRARIDHLVTGFVDFLVENRHFAVMAATDRAAKRHRLDDTQDKMRERVITLFFGEHPTGAERLAYHAVFSVPDGLGELVDLTDEELRETLQTTILRILRVPS